jgi:hypothetical protein
MAAPGAKAKFLNQTDMMLADDLQALYSIDLALAKSPKLKVKCGAITVFKTNNEQLDLNPEKFDEKSIVEMQQQLRDTTQVMWGDPELFKESEGKWLPWAIERMFQLFKQFNGNATFAIVCAELQIHERISKSRILKERSDPKKLFATAFEVDRLLDKDYRFDPWLKRIRRGRIGAKFAKR